MRKEKITINTIVNSVNNFNFDLYEAKMYDYDKEILANARRTYVTKYAMKLTFNELATLYSGEFYSSTKSPIESIWDYYNKEVK